MSNNDAIFNKIAEALLIDYSSVYYVNAVTNEYRWYSVDPQFNALHIEHFGSDFFVNLVRDADKVVYEEDKHLFVEELQKDKMLAEMKEGTVLTFDYRLMLEGKPVYHNLTVIRGVGEDKSMGDDYFILGVKNIDKNARMKRERRIYNQIAAGLALKFDTIYYVDIKTHNYFEFASNDDYKSLNVPQEGEDFFAESQKNIGKYVHPDDREMVIALHTPEAMLENLRAEGKFTISYRLKYLGEYKYFRHSEFWAKDKKHIIICMENIDSEVKKQRMLEESHRQSITFEQIAETLASRYDVIYYVNSEDSHYSTFITNEIYGSLELREEGVDFFADAQRNSHLAIHESDLDRVLGFLNRDYIITKLEEKKQFVAEYRLTVNDSVQDTRMTISWSGDRKHFIIGVENIEEELRMKKEKLRALNLANELARRDELTGTRNRYAYREFEKSLGERLDSTPGCEPFAIAVCDINNLKSINNAHGHKAGDEYLRAASRLIRSIFPHSPVFRIDGDEFAAVLSGSDLTEKKDLLERFRIKVNENLEKRNGPVVAIGIADYDPAYDRSVAEVFERAQTKMNEDKLMLKEKTALKMMYSEAELKYYEPITEDRRIKLDTLFNAFTTISNGTYVFVCDMLYNYSRWSRNAVDTFGLPSEYMYNAGGIWEEHIHEEDRENYHKGIEKIFMGRSSGHDLQYRARRINGEYDVCVCCGTVLKNPDGKVDYFVGTIRNLGLHGNIDSITGLRNQYGFFEDLQNKMTRNTEMKICLVGIGKFSEINEVYGYHFGNRILQEFGRYLFEHVGNTGAVYRMDGTKFAVISTLTAEEIYERYDDLRTHFRAGFTVGDRNVILDLNAGMLTVDNFRIDYQTVYSCLNFSYGESKLRRQGDLVEFYNDLNDHNKQRLEKLQTIRASIMQEHKGFFLMYQPVVDAKEEKLIGAEALIRWRSDEYGMVPPDHFIPILEKDPLFFDLGEWILRTALRDAKKLMELNGNNFMINVNLSYTQLEKPNFTEMVFAALKAEDFPAEHLCLEITERCRLLDMDLLKNIVVNLRAGGIKIALDDFGTGFSSVGVVKMLPFDIIKIDRSFVLKIEEDEKERALIRSFAGVASTFGAKVCVEGIETSEMRNILQHYNIQSFQGYYYSKPLALDDFVKWRENYLNRNNR